MDSGNPGTTTPTGSSATSSGCDCSVADRRSPWRGSISAFLLAVATIAGRRWRSHRSLTRP
jgi:MYXO-CTERM domain-containing protein